MGAQGRTAWNIFPLFNYFLKIKQLGARMKPTTYWWLGKLKNHTTTTTTSCVPYVSGPLISGCSTVVESMPCKREVVGSILAGCWIVFYPSIISNMQVPRGGAALLFFLFKKESQIFGHNKLNKHSLGSLKTLQTTRPPPPQVAPLLLFDQSAGSYQLSHVWFSRLTLFRGFLDEAGETTEPESMIPIGLLASQVVLAGDPKQVLSSYFHSV